MSRELTLLGRQRLSVYLYASFILLLVVPFILLAFPVLSPLIISANVILWCLAAIILSLYIIRRLPLSAAISILALVVQLELVVEMIYCSTYPISYMSLILLTDLLLSSVVVVLAATAYMRFMPYLLSALAIGAYAYTMLVTRDSFLQNFLMVFCFVFLVICLFGTSIRRNIVLLEHENEGLRKDEQDLLWLLRMNRKQVQAFVELSKAETLPRTGELLDMVGESMRYRILDMVSAWQKKKEMDAVDMMQKFPELTPSEREICSLILQDKKQSDICILLNKEASNINSQRAHIRKKLKLSPSDNLKDVLRNRLETYGTGLSSSGKK